MAATLRALSDQVEPPFSLSSIIRSVFPTVIVTGRDLPAGVEEVAALTCDGPLIIYRRDLPLGARRFAIAHALAHLLYDADTKGVQPGRPFSVRREIRADVFALELLAPHVSMIRHVLIWPSAGEPSNADQSVRIAASFGVPPVEIDKRIRALAMHAK